MLKDLVPKCNKQGRIRRSGWSGLGWSGLGRTNFLGIQWLWLIIIWGVSLFMMRVGVSRTRTRSQVLILQLLIWQTWTLLLKPCGSLCPGLMTSLASIPDKPNQPTSSFQFPKRTFGKTKIVSRSCQCSWFARWPFLHLPHVCTSVQVQQDENY